MRVATIAGAESGDIPDKLYFRMGEVSQLVGVEPYVLRYWEKEFPTLAPRKSGKGQRLYRRQDVETALEIKRLLYEKRYTIEGARKFLKGRRRREPSQPAAKADHQQALFPTSGLPVEALRREIEEILALLK